MKADVKEFLIGLVWVLVVATLVVLGVVGAKTAIIFGFGLIGFSLILIFISIAIETMKDK